MWIIIFLNIIFFFYLLLVIAESKIESASDLDREFADKPTRSFHCCARHEKKVDVGYGKYLNYQKFDYFLQ